MADPSEKDKSASPTTQFDPAFEEPLEEIYDTRPLSPSHFLQGEPTSDEPGPNLLEISAQQQQEELQAEILAAQAEIDKAAEDGTYPAEVIARMQQDFDSARAQFAPGILPVIREGETAALHGVRNELEKENARWLQATLGSSPGISRAEASAKEAQLEAALRDIKAIEKLIDIGREREAKLLKENAELRDAQRSRDEEVAALRNSYEDLSKNYNDDLVHHNLNVPGSKLLVDANEQLNDRLEKLKLEKERSNKETEEWKEKYKDLEIETERELQELEEDVRNYQRGRGEDAQAKLINRLKKQLDIAKYNVEEMQKDLGAAREKARQSAISEQSRQADVQVKNEEIRRLKKKFAAIELTPDQEKLQELLDEIDGKDDVIQAMDNQIAEQDEAARQWSEEAENYDQTIRQLRQEVDERDDDVNQTIRELETANKEIKKAVREIQQQAAIIDLGKRDATEQSEMIAKLIREITETKLQLSIAQISDAENVQKTIEFEKEVIMANISSIEIHLTFMVLQRALHGCRRGDTAAAQEAANLAVHGAEELFEIPHLVAVARYWRGIVRYYNGDRRVAFEEFKAAAADWQEEEVENLNGWIAAANPDTGREAPRRRNGYRKGLGFSPRELRASPYRVDGDVKLRPHLYVRPLDVEGQRIFDTIDFGNDFDYDRLSPEQQALFSFEPPVGDILLRQHPEDYPLPPSPRYGSADLPRKSDRPASDYGGVAPISTSSLSSAHGSRESGARPPSLPSPTPAPPPEPSRLTEFTTDAALNIQYLIAQLDKASQRIRELERDRELFQDERNVRLRREAQIRELRQEMAGVVEELEGLRRPWWIWVWGR